MRITILLSLVVVALLTTTAAAQPAVRICTDSDGYDAGDTIEVSINSTTFPQFKQIILHLCMFNRASEAVQ